MVTLSAYFLIGLLMNSEIEIFNFNSKNSSGNWRIINDVVMGGISKSSFTIKEDGTAVFEGKLSPDNNGGFASARTELEKLDDTEYSGVIIRAKGDGNIYNIRFRTNLDYDGISYQAKFKSSDQWQEFKIPFDKFVPTFRGRTFDNQPKLESKNIKQMGILIADKQFGAFSVQLDWIKFYID
jgi:monofunctional biosynthetic peptidoglycan transglycosylase